ncbi:MAG: hypothetical protein IPN08_10000 [Bacteroidales bacterium]|nr:hypothetical protein [Bacteroidales bacterium]
MTPEQTLYAKLRDVYTARNSRYPSDLTIPIPNIRPSDTNGLEKSIVAYVNAFGWQAERVKVRGTLKDNRVTFENTAGMYRTIGSIGYIPGTGQKGSADLSATIPLLRSNGYGVKVAIEVKWGKDRIRTDQVEYKKQIEQSGGVSLIVKVWADFFEWFHANADFSKVSDPIFPKPRKKIKDPDGLFNWWDGVEPITEL